RKDKKQNTSVPPPPITEEEVEKKLSQAEKAGINVESALQELEGLRSRRTAGEIHVTLFGQVSTGKSSIVRSLLPEARPEVDPRAGTTRTIDRFCWTSPAGDRLILTDLPGLNEPDGTMNQLAREEALRAHLVVYLVDGDLSRDQFEELKAITTLEKPVIMALNKADLYTKDELTKIRIRLGEHTKEMQKIELVAVSAGAIREMTIVHPDGREEVVQREVQPQVAELVSVLQRRLDGDNRALEQLRDASVFVLASRKIDEALKNHRRTKSEQIVTEHTRMAVLGALAAVTPGTDILIQGYLGVRLVKSLCELHEVSAHHMNIDQFLQMAGERFGKVLPLSLAIAGNALKAFPGVGTLAGGITHAVAYGLLFDSLGRAVSRTLESRGALPAAVTLRTFEETLSENLGTRARRLAKLALQQLRTAGKGTERTGE
ncbi:MAG: GTP-binding protein, partial [Gammaproteobacteria bacterium]|nr:GTP-binding protein [Gammaproteobacteria bacterium]